MIPGRLLPMQGTQPMTALKRCGCLGSFLLLGWCGPLGCSGQGGLLDAGAFTEECRQALLDTSSELKVRKVRDLELRIEGPKGGGLVADLDTAYEKYRRNPLEKNALLSRFAQNSWESLNKKAVHLDREMIFPLIRGPLAWKAPVNPSHCEPAAVGQEVISEPFLGELSIVYAMEAENCFRLIGPADLTEAKIDPVDLRAIACDNLKRSLPKIDGKPLDGVYKIMADGNHETSLVLFNSLWDGHQFKVKGEIVIGMPSKEILLVTGTEEPGGIASLRQKVEMHFRNGSCPITNRLFVRVDGSFVEWTGAEQTHAPEKAVSVPSDHK